MFFLAVIRYFVPVLLPRQWFSEVFPERHSYTKDGRKSCTGTIKCYKGIALIKRATFSLE
ncbi:hypothetical protein NQ317_017160 [Molorchus minor]|uniref:Uncharacterized protein n=1 Tax=Molorchus minor TaxID=1323400 RepID=A0ABQ9J023_9CUCU|nr:hypothetical protein NQ317_017160 [Molorchus minor]